MVGHETISTTLCFSLFALAHDLPFQQRLRDELKRFKSDAGREPTYNDYLTRLPVLDAMCKET